MKAAECWKERPPRPFKVPIAAVNPIRLEGGVKLVCDIVVGSVRGSLVVMLDLGTRSVMC